MGLSAGSLTIGTDYLTNCSSGQSDWNVYQGMRASNLSAEQFFPSVIQRLIVVRL